MSNPSYFFADCEGPLPEIQNAVCTETFGLYRNLGTGISFKCKDGLALIGRPFAVCTENREWKILFCCIEPGRFILFLVY